MMISGVRRLSGFRQRRRFGDGEVRSGEVEGLPHRRRPQPSEDVQLLGQPAPSPNSTRPQLISSTSTTEIANGPGWRNLAEVTIVPRQIEDLSLAIPARVTQESVGPGRPSPLIAR